KVGAEQAYLDGMQVGIVSTADVSVRIGELADHLAHNVGQAVTVGDVRQQLSIFVTGLCPIHSVHRSFEKVVTLLAPHFVEDLLPLLRRVHFGLHAAEAESAVTNFLGLSVGFGIDNSIAVSAS